MNNEILKFLLGEGPIDGVWFGEKHPAYEGNFWWRNHLRQYMEKQAQLQQHGVSGKRPTDEEIISRAKKRAEAHEAYGVAEQSFIDGARWVLAACASGAVDTVAEAEESNFDKRNVWKRDY